MNELLAQGLQLMGVGMGFVFLFLGLLVAVVSLVSRIIQGYEGKHAAPAGTSTTNDDDLLLVVSEAIKRYRQEHNR
ncbi:oxaloacetate decarboxylase, gamma subunit [Mariprofundus micogutta]|uniref:Oxaloacetate decarboxylase gamma chain n=1 Tax=Mariprofundus micogutta TaxID=1921010 RepID=A0A1L8CND1_9PROT|nr:OadG family transporter subunit [Mariprofundus micogutta]GAV20425.1 oxaloacetate decarboxylase, gamma subunit [Mariprofundus micogutta]